LDIDKYINEGYVDFEPLSHSKQNGYPDSKQNGYHDSKQNGYHDSKQNGYNKSKLSVDTEKIEEMDEEEKPMVGTFHLVGFSQFFVFSERKCDSQCLI